MAPTRIRLERILCPTDFSDFSEHALRRAVKLARWFDARVTVLHAAPLMPWAVSATAAYGAYVGGRSDPFLPTRDQDAEALGRFVGPLLGEGVPIETSLVEGDPAREIEAAAVDLPADLVVMGTHGRSGFEHLLLGSITEKVLRRSACPVLTVGRPAQDSSQALFRRILCAVDLTPASRATIDFALSLAEENLARVTLLHVVEGVLGEDGRELYRPIPDAPALRRALVEDARAQLSEAGRGAHSFCEVSERLEAGKAWRELLRVAGETYADLIVMGAHAHGALGRLFLGSTANQVVRHAPCPVLVVREEPRRGAALRPQLAVAL